tara:strand:- start:959 stop:1186 length:228 start_codon:yes stop_codon:yes gene_type:complete
MKHEVKILDLKVKVTTFEDKEIQVDVYCDGVEQASGYIDTSDESCYDLEEEVYGDVAALYLFYWNIGLAVAKKLS